MPFQSVQNINARVVQGSALGPILFNVNTSNLKAKVPGIIYVKYADNCYLVVPAANTSSSHDEMRGIEQWSAVNNQKNKHKEVVRVDCSP